MGSPELPMLIGELKFRKNTFTTGQVAKVLALAPRTVAKLFDHGLLKGYIIPTTSTEKPTSSRHGGVGGDRRILKSSLILFARERQIPLPAWMVDGMDPQNTLTGWKDAVTPTQLGALVAQGKVTAVIIGCGEGLSTALEVAKAVLAIHHISIALVLSEDYGDRHPEVPYPTFVTETASRAWLASLSIKES